MKKLTSRWILLIIIPITVFSCKKILDKPPQNEYSNTSVLSDLSLIEDFVNYVFHDALGLPFDIIRLSDLSDESFFPPDWGTHEFYHCEIFASDVPGWSAVWASPQTVHFLWSPMYSNVRRTNLFFSKIGALKTDEYDLVTHLKGEVYFLRGWIS